MKTKQLYVTLFEKKEKNSIALINNISNDSEHHFWGACRDFAREILIKSNNWRWLSYRVDDFAILAQKNMQKKLQKWLFKAMLKCSKMPIDNLKSTILWLMDRFVAELKNLFDFRSKNFLDISKIDSMILYYSIDGGNYA